MLVVAAISFPLHFAWEWLQCQPYFIHLATPPTVGAMLLATTGDVMLTLAIYTGVRLACGPAWPLGSWPAAAWVVMLTLALVISVAIEHHALKTGRWSYTEHAPIIPGSSLSALPIAQLLLLVPLSFGLARVLWSLRRR